MHIIYPEGGKSIESTLTYLHRLTAETHTLETEVLTHTFQVDLREFWHEHILGRYLCHEIFREKVIIASETVRQADCPYRFQQV